MFTLIVPVGQSAYSEAERSHEQVNQLEAFPLEENPLPVKPDPDLDKEKKTIMVVDDDSEVAYYLEMLLGSDYQSFAVLMQRVHSKLLQRMLPI